MKKLYITILLLAFILPLVAGNIIYPENIKYSFTTEREGNTLNINIDILLDNVHIPSQGMVVLTPVIRTQNRGDYHLSPAVIAGAKRYKVIDRLFAYGNPVFEQAPQVFVKREGKSQRISLTYALTYEEWLYGSDLYIYGDASGCVNCGNIQNEYLVETNIVPSLFMPQYLVSYIVPEAEIKERNETFVARINYVVDRYELLPDYKNNGAILREVDAVIRELQSNPDLTITHHTVTGYASPEGNFNSNIILSKNRAKSFMNYLQQKYNWDTDKIRYDGKGEDWDGLRKAVVGNPNIPYREEVVQIIDNIPDIAKRKRLLQALDGGKAYSQLLKEIYPPLRRNEFEIAYIARSFNVDEAREMIRKRPQLFNLNEMFLVANSYPKDSREFKEVFDIAVRMFPDNNISKINAAAMEIETGSSERAIERLQGIDTGEAWNNMGVAYALQENFEEARRYFQQAIQAGNENARHNFEQLNKKEENKRSLR